MYFLLANAKEKFHYLSHALGGILIFVGIKMTISHWYHMNTYVSLDHHRDAGGGDRVQPRATGRWRQHWHPSSTNTLTEQRQA